MSAVAPYAVGAMAETHGLGFAFWLVAAAFAVAALLALLFPKGRARPLDA